MNRRVYAYVRIYAFLYAYTRIFIRTYVNTYTHIRVYLYAYTRILIRTYTYTYTHIRVYLFAYYTCFLVNVYLSGTVCLLAVPDQEEMEITWNGLVARGRVALLKRLEDHFWTNIFSN